MEYYHVIHTETRDGFDIIVDQRAEDIPIRDMFDDTCHDIRDLEDKVNRGFYEWFMLRVRAFIDGHEMASEYLGACMYEDCREVMEDGTAEDLIQEALHNARKEAVRLRERLAAAAA
jgi:hypothetical protein